MTDTPTLKVLIFFKKYYEYGGSANMCNESAISVTYF
jgi:hypothetical protein